MAARHSYAVVLHRRRTGSISGPTASTASTSSPSLAPPSQPPANLAYQPLRRRSSQLYPTSTGSTPVTARYSIPGTPYDGGLAPPTAGYGAGAGFELGDGGGLGGSGARDWKEWARREVERIKDGVRDAAKLDRSWSLVWGDPELRTLVLKSTLINLLSLLLLSLFPVLLSPLLSAGNAASRTLVETRTKEIGLWYNILLSWPVFVVCFWVNASWGPDISRRAQTLLHPSYRHQPNSTPSTSTNGGPSTPSAPFDAIAWLWSSATRLIMISDFTLLTRIVALVPLIGRPTAFAYMCIINAYYGFEWTFVARHWPLEYRTAFVQDRAAYMFGFGLPATLMTSFGPPLVKMAVFALIYPFFVIQALQSRPPPPSSGGGTAGLLATTPTSASAYSLPPSPASASATLDDPFFAPPASPSRGRGGTGSGGFAERVQEWVVYGTRVPVFLLARHVLDGMRWLEAAVGRDRSGAGGSRRRSYERPGKRLG